MTEIRKWETMTPERMEQLYQKEIKDCQKMGLGYWSGREYFFAELRDGQERVRKSWEEQGLLLREEDEATTEQGRER